MADPQKKVPANRKTLLQKTYY